MTTVHEGTANEVSKVETRTGVCNVKPNHAGIRVTCILGESGQGVLVVTEVPGKRGGVEDLGHLVHCEGHQFAGLLITLK